MCLIPNVAPYRLLSRGMLKMQLLVPSCYLVMHLSYCNIWWYASFALQYIPLNINIKQKTDFFCPLFSVSARCVRVGLGGPLVCRGCSEWLFWGLFGCGQTFSLQGRPGFLRPQGGFARVRGLSFLRDDHRFMSLM